MSKTGSSVYFGGVPTEPDVNKLIEAFKVQDMAPGDTILYSEVSKVIEQEYGTSRWQSDTNAWRKKVERVYGIIIGCDSVKPKSDSKDTEDTEYEKSFHILTEPDKVDFCGKKLRSAVKYARRSYIVAGNVDVKKLNDDQKKTYDFNRLTSSNIIATAQLRSGKNLLPEMTGK